MAYEVFVVVMFVVGLAFGSFANVVVWRFPRGESLSTPPSHCPTCDERIRWYDNVPIVSWVLLRGRCRACKSAIAVRYPVVEITSGLLWLIAALHFGASPRAIIAALFFYLLLILSAIDLDTRRLPNPIVGLCAAVGLIGALISQLTPVAAVPLIDFGGWLASPLVASLVGAVASSGISLAIALAYAGMRKREGFGMGDVKLLAAIGVYLGPYGMLVLFLASIIGALVGVIVASRSEEGLSKAYPFGPFLALSAIVIGLYGTEMWSWYTGLVAA